MNSYFIPTRPLKSLVASILLTLLFGPIGLFYASIIGGLVMTFLVPLILAVFTIFSVDNTTTDTLYDSYVIIGSSWIIFLILYWPICILWGVISVNKYNAKIHSETANQMFVAQSNNNSVVDSPLQQWLKANPGKGINDFYKRSR